MKCTYPLFSKGKMSRDCIKYIAMAAMFCNHFATVFLKGQTLLYEIFIDIGYFNNIFFSFIVLCCIYPFQKKIWTKTFRVCVDLADTISNGNRIFGAEYDVYTIYLLFDPHSTGICMESAKTLSTDILIVHGNVVYGLGDFSAGFCGHVCKM